MLLGIDVGSCFPTGEVAFLAFRLAAKETLAQLAAQQDRDPGDADDHVGFLGEVELLQPLKTIAQVRLLSDAWRLHTSPVVHQASYLEAAVVFAACKTAADLIRADPAKAMDYTQGSPRRLYTPLTRRTADRIEEAFKGVFWEELGMLRGDEPWPTTPAEQAQAEADHRLPDGCFRPLFHALSGLIADDEIDPRLDRLVGLLTVAEVYEAAALLEVDPPTCLLGL